MSQLRDCCLYPVKGNVKLFEIFFYKISDYSKLPEKKIYKKLNLIRTIIKRVLGIMSVQSIVETSFAIESIFLASEVFVLGFYLSQWEEGSDKLKILLYLAITLIVPAFLLIAVDLILLIALESNFLIKTVYIGFSIVLSIPNAATVILILKRKP
jgi:hypothetical protein